MGVMKKAFNVPKSHYISFSHQINLLSILHILYFSSLFLVDLLSHNPLCRTA